MVKTQTVSIRLTPEKLSSLREEAKIQGKPMSDVLQEQLLQVNQVHMLQQKLDDLEWELNEMKKRTNKTTPKKFRVSVSLDQNQYRLLQQITKENQISKSEAIRNLIGIVSQKQANPMLK